jgi:pimeloyl-ACP methyl ester carboxylesterase
MPDRPPPPWTQPREPGTIAAVTTYVLVHGAWHGGWAWQRVVPALRAEGHEVHTPTLAGVSDRAHLLSRAITLGTHVEDITAYLEAYDLSDVVLVGHSYGGQVISGVADRVPERIRVRVYLDAFLPDDGEAAVDLMTAPIAQHYRDSVAEHGFGWLIPPRPLQAFGVTEEADLAWLTPRLTPHPWPTFTEPIRLTGAGDVVPGVYIECAAGRRPFQSQAARAADRGWPVHEMPTGHEAMVTMPAELAGLLLDVVR